MRVAELQETTPLAGPQATVSARNGVSLGAGGYVVTVNLGTPPRAQTVLFDTASFLSWIQCKPCVAPNCYPQEEPLFDPSLSSTHRKFGCAEPTCLALGNRGCSGPLCVYEVPYRDGSATLGLLSSDTLALGPADAFPGFVFGCGLRNRNRGVLGRAAGVLSLGRSPYSLNSQLSSRLRNVFSYCLPASSGAGGYLNVGGPVRADAVYTPMVPRPTAPGRYFVDLLGISVGGTPLPIPAGVFRGPGTLIDTGVAITRLPPAAYGALRTAFRAAMVRYALVQGDGVLDTCYDLSGVRGDVAFPEVRMQFTGATIKLPFAGVFYLAGPRKTCLAFAGNASPTDLGIIGNTQQKTFEVIYDNTGNRVGFSPGACS